MDLHARVHVNYSHCDLILLQIVLILMSVNIKVPSLPQARFPPKPSEGKVDFIVFAIFSIGILDQAEFNYFELAV